MGKGKWLVGFVVVMLAAAGAVCAQEDKGSDRKAPEGSSQIVAGGAVGQVAAMTAEVAAIDAASREVTLKMSDGKEKKIVVGPEAYNFDQVKVGDIVNIAYKESVALYVDRMPSEPDANAATVLARAPKGQKPEGVLASAEEVTATVTDIDYQKRTISLLGPEGNAMTMSVPADAAPNFDKIQKGDTVVLRYTQALAIKVEPAAPAANQ